MPTKGLVSVVKNSKLSSKARMRLAWMDYLDNGHTIAPLQYHKEMQKKV